MCVCVCVCVCLCARVLTSVLTFLKSSVHLRVGEKLEGEVTWPWQTGQHFTQTLMQHGTHTSPHTAERKRRERERDRGERLDITARQHMARGNTEAEFGLIELSCCSLEEQGSGRHS